jgi:hypothetical protein
LHPFLNQNHPFVRLWCFHDLDYRNNTCTQRTLSSAMTQVYLEKIYHVYRIFKGLLLKLVLCD